MSYSLSPASLDKMKKTHPDLRKVVIAAMSKQAMDFSVMEGTRSMETQRSYVLGGVSKTMNSKHLLQHDGYSYAVDLYPHPIDMKSVNAFNAREISRFGVLAGIVLTTAKELKIPVKWGGDWDMDGETLDHTFFDAPHFELVR